MRARLGRLASGALRWLPRGGAGAARRDRGRNAEDCLTWAIVGFAGAALLGVGCHDAGREQAERDTRDHARLEAIVTADEDVDRALKRADDASRAGDDAKAAALLDDEGARAAAAAVEEAEREPLETPWARSRRDAVLDLIRERRASIPGYAQALRGEDLEAKLDAIKVQIALQKKALDVVAAALAAPGPLPDAG